MHLRGCDILSIRDQLGHRNVQTTLTYVTNSPKIHRYKYDRYCPIYQESQRPRQMEKFVTGEFTFGADPLNNEASHNPPKAGATSMTLAEVMGELSHASKPRGGRILIGGSSKGSNDEKEGECRIINLHKSMFIEADEERIVPVELLEKETQNGSGAKRQGARKGKRSEKPAKGPKKRKEGESTKTTRKKRTKKAKKKALSAEWLAILNHMKEGNTVTNTVYRELTGAMRSRATRQMARMIKENLIVREGTRGRSVKYTITAAGQSAIA